MTTIVFGSCGILRTSLTEALSNSGESVICADVNVAHDFDGDPTAVQLDVTDERSVEELVAEKGGYTVTVASPVELVERLFDRTVTTDPDAHPKTLVRASIPNVLPTSSGTSYGRSRRQFRLTPRPQCGNDRRSWW